MRRAVMCVLIIVLFLPFTGVKALSVSNNNVIVSEGGSDEVELYADVINDIKEISFSLVYSTYDISANFVADSLLKNVSYSVSGVKHTISFDEKKNGKILLGVVKIDASNAKINTIGTINIYNVTAVDVDNKVVTLNGQTITVKVDNSSTEKKNIDGNDDMLLDSIYSDIVKIDLEKGIFKYDVFVDSNISKLDLKPVAIDKDCIVDISTQEIGGLSNSQIVITARLNDVTQKYVINVKPKDEERDIVIDNSEFTRNNNYKKKWLVIIAVLCVILLFNVIIVKLKNR